MRPLSLILILFYFHSLALAQTGQESVRFSGNGFLTLGVGKMLGGDSGRVLDRDRPLFVSDYAQAGVYDGRGGLQMKPDSKLGLQGEATLVGTGFSATAQMVVRGAREAANLEWLYGSYVLNEKTTLQVGRKRLPMFYHSETQDIGFSMPWTHLPPQLYGWEAVNYNGINLLHQNQWGDLTSTLNLLAGAESKKETGYWKIYRGSTNRTDIEWNNILGGDLTLAHGSIETRFVYIQSKTREKNITAGTDWTPLARQKIYGIAFNVDHNNWLARTEFIHIDRPGANFKDFAQILALGRRWGAWQSILTWSGYHANANLSAGGDPNGQEAHENRSITLRYDLTPSSALKVQFDNQKDRSGSNWTPRYGDARLLTFAYDQVF